MLILHVLARQGLLIPCHLKNDVARLLFFDPGFRVRGVGKAPTVSSPLLDRLLTERLGPLHDDERCVLRMRIATLLRMQWQNNQPKNLDAALDSVVEHQLGRKDKCK
jgi:hypothetical protein